MNGYSGNTVPRGREGDDAIFAAVGEFLTVQVPENMLEYKHMSETHIICKPTTDTFVRFGIVIAALFGFAVYFFYDGHTGYRQKNEVICSFKAFAELGKQALECTETEWVAEMSSRPLIATEQVEGELMAVLGDQRYPLPPQCEAAVSCPPEVLNHAAMSSSWSDCWAAYSRRLQLPISPGEHAYDLGAIREQWIAGGVFILLGCVLLYFALRTRGRVMELRGDCLTVAGQQFRVADISHIDLRQWGPGFKGCATLTVNGRKLKADGMTYGGFNKEKGEPAEQFMQALLAQYQGEITEYEAPSNSDSGD